MLMTDPCSTLPTGFLLPFAAFDMPSALTDVAQMSFATRALGMLLRSV